MSYSDVALGAQGAPDDVLVPKVSFPWSTDDLMAMTPAEPHLSRSLGASIDIQRIDRDDDFDGEGWRRFMAADAAVRTIDSVLEPESRDHDPKGSISLERSLSDDRLGLNPILEDDNRGCSQDLLLFRGDDSSEQKQGASWMRGAEPEHQLHFMDCLGCGNRRVLGMNLFKSSAGRGRSSERRAYLLRDLRHDMRSVWERQADRIWTWCQSSMSRLPRKHENQKLSWGELRGKECTWQSRLQSRRRRFSEF